MMCYVLIISEDRENTSGLGFGLLTSFIQLTNQMNRGSEGSAVTIQWESTQSGGEVHLCTNRTVKYPMSHACVTFDVRYMVQGRGGGGC